VEQEGEFPPVGIDLGTGRFFKRVHAIRKSRDLIRLLCAARERATAALFPSWLPGAEFTQINK
jgi:hypothetical protein